MKTTQSSGTRPVHQTVAGTFEFKASTASQSPSGSPISRLSVRTRAVRLSGACCVSGDWFSTLACAFCRMRSASVQQSSAAAGERRWPSCTDLLCDARKLTHVAYLRRDPLVPELLGITPGGQSVGAFALLSRVRLRRGPICAAFRPLWHWCLDRLPSVKEGYTLDLDSTRLLHEDGHQEGVAVRLHPAGTQALSASAAGGVGRSAVGGATVVAARQQPLAATTSPRSFWICGRTCRATFACAGCGPIRAFACRNCWRCGNSCTCPMWSWRN